MARREITTFVNAGVLFVLAAGAAARAVALPLSQLTEPGGHVQIAAGSQVLERPAGLPVGTSVAPIRALDAVWLEVAELPARLRLLTEAGAAVGSLAWAIGLILVALVIRDIGRARAFDPRVPHRIAIVAGVIVAGDVCSHALDWAAANVVVDRFDAHATVFPYPQVMPIASLVVAAFVLVVAEAFRQGGRLAADVEGLV